MSKDKVPDSAPDEEGEDASGYPAGQPPPSEFDWDEFGLSEESGAGEESPAAPVSLGHPSPGDEVPGDVTAERPALGIKMVPDEPVDMTAERPALGIKMLPEETGEDPALGIRMVPEETGEGPRGGPAEPKPKPPVAPWWRRRSIRVAGMLMVAAVPAAVTYQVQQGRAIAERQRAEALAAAALEKEAADAEKRVGAGDEAQRARVAALEKEAAAARMVAEAQRARVAALEKEAAAARKVAEAEVEAERARVAALEKEAAARMVAGVGAGDEAQRARVAALEKEAAAAKLVTEAQRARVAALEKEAADARMVAEAEVEAERARVAALEKEAAAAKKMAGAGAGAGDEAQRERVAALEKQAADARKMAEAERARVAALEKQAAVARKMAEAEVEVERARVAALEKEVADAKKMAGTPLDPEAPEIEVPMRLEEAIALVQKPGEAAKGLRRIVESNDPQVFEESYSRMREPLMQSGRVEAIIQECREAADKETDPTIQSRYLQIISRLRRERAKRAAAEGTDRQGRTHPIEMDPVRPVSSSTRTARPRLVRMVSQRAEPLPPGLQDYDDVISDLGEAIRRNPNNLSAYADLGESRLERGQLLKDARQYDRAKQSYDEAIRDIQTGRELLLRAAPNADPTGLVARRLLDGLNQAINLQRGLPGVPPNNAALILLEKQLTDAKANLAQAEQQRDQLWARIRAATPSPVARPEDAYDAYSAGSDRLHQGDYDGAIRRISEAISWHPTDARFYFSRGIARYLAYRNGSPVAPEDADADMRQGVELERRDHPTPVEVGRALARVQGDVRNWVESYRNPGRDGTARDTAVVIGPHPPPACLPAAAAIPFCPIWRP